MSRPPTFITIRNLPPTRGSHSARETHEPGAGHMKRRSASASSHASNTFRGGDGTSLSSSSFGTGSLTTPALSRTTLALRIVDERVEPRAPEVMMCMKELVRDLQRAPVDRDPVHASFDATPHEPGTFEHLDVLGDAVLRHRERLPDHADRQLARLSQERDDLAAHRIGQAMKDAIQTLLLASLPAARDRLHAIALRRNTPSRAEDRLVQLRTWSATALPGAG